MQNYKSKDKPYPANIFSRKCLLESAFLKPTTVTNSFLIRKHICKLFFYQININMNSSATIVESIKKEVCIQLKNFLTQSEKRVNG